MQSMTGPHVLRTAGLHHRRPKQAHKPRTLRADRPLLLWRKMIEFTVGEAKKTVDGFPTDLAILARWWIADFQPPKTDKDEWERSFACACHWLGVDAAKERKRLLDEIDGALMKTFVESMRAALYLRRAAVLTCAGVPSAIARQFVLPLVSPATYDEVSGVETMDFFPDDLDAHVAVRDEPAKPARRAQRCSGSSSRRG